MLKIHQLFLRSFILIFFSILIIISIIIYFWSKSIYLEQVEKSILINIDTFVISLPNLLDIDEKVKKIKQATNLRITIVNKQGVVLAESHEDKKSMENHLHRKEINQANYNKYGKIIRYSNTINEELLYIAKKVSIGNEEYFVRMARAIDIIQDNFIRLTLQIIAIFSIFLLVAFLVSYKISKKIQNETNNILNYLINLTKKKDSKYISSFYTYEFYTINKLLNKVALKLSKKDQIKAKHTAKLKLANRQKDEIISAISHEFKNPIAIITGYTQTILNDKDLPKSIQAKFLTKIDSNANKMIKIIDKLRLTLTLEEGKERLDKKELDLQNICNLIISDLKDKYPNREILLQGSSKILNADETLISMAISNLVENAIKYSEDEVIIKISENSLKIIDKGIGISQEELLKITKKFYRVSQNGWNNSLGLGLYIVHIILNLHNFKLEINSIYNQGSEFIINY